MSVVGPLSYRISQVGPTCVADLDSRALALTKEASGNSRDTSKKTKKKKKMTMMMMM